ncbi:MAG: hypothetical protein NT099_08715, partial [Candidatus Saganbacteria bacterium]|nr:hypothetical protein [Candidatus Saganbacteria bacterium]
LFGEDHVRNINAHRFIRGSIQALGAEGFKAYGVELLNVADTDLVGAFNKGGDRERTALKSHIEDSWNTGFMAAAADTHMEIFDAAKEAGITVYPMTHPRIWDHLTVAPSFPFGVRLGEEPRARDCFMSLAANHALVEIGKSVVLAGRGHIDVNNGLPSVLRLGFGYESISVALVEREDVTDPFMVKYTSEIRRIVPAWRTLNWNVNDAPPQEADWLVFFPHAPRSEA